MCLWLGSGGLQARAAGFVDAALSQAAQTKGSHVMFTMGSDFQFQSSAEWFVNLDKLIHYCNELFGDQVIGPMALASCRPCYPILGRRRCTCFHVSMMCQACNKAVVPPSPLR